MAPRENEFDTPVLGDCFWPYFAGPKVGWKDSTMLKDVRGKQITF